MITKETLQYLKDLKKNNNRIWFIANKPRYDTARAEFEKFVSRLILEIACFDPAIGELEAKRCIFRIYRDTRFSTNKIPYKINFGAHLVARESKVHDRAGYYVHLEPGNNFLAGGAYLPPAPWLNAIRRAIDQNGRKLDQIMNDPSFKKYFAELEGEKLKTTPRDYPANHPYIELLRFKSFTALHPLSNQKVLADNFLKHCVEVFAALKPFNDFLNRSISADLL
jgi:uncharacterized protein (TIGR02453 family)